MVEETGYEIDVEDKWENIQMPPGLQTIEFPAFPYQNRITDTDPTEFNFKEGRKKQYLVMTNATL